MRTRKAFRTASIIAVLVGVLGIALPASAGDGLPFKGVAQAVIIGAVPVGDTLELTVVGTGQATHLGRFSRVENLVAHADGTVTGTLTFTAANKQTLVASVDGGFTSAPNTL